MSEPNTEVQVLEYPECDVCGEEAHFDAKTIGGPWANLCDVCWPIFTHRKLGLGRGQRLVKVSEQELTSGRRDADV